MREKQPSLKLLKCLHNYHREEPFTTLKMVLRLSWLAIAMNFVEVFFLIDLMLLFFCAYSMFFSKFKDGYMRDSMKYLKMIEQKSWNCLEICLMLTTLMSVCLYIYICILLIFIWAKKQNQNTTRFGNKLCECFSNFLSLAKFFRLEETVDWSKLLKFGRTCSNLQSAIGMNTKIGEPTLFKSETE